MGNILAISKDKSKCKWNLKYKTIQHFENPRLSHFRLQHLRKFRDPHSQDYIHHARHCNFRNIDC